MTDILSLLISFGALIVAALAYKTSMRTQALEAQFKIGEMIQETIYLITEAQFQIEKSNRNVNQFEEILQKVESKFKDTAEHEIKGLDINIYNAKEIILQTRRSNDATKKEIEKNKETLELLWKSDSPSTDLIANLQKFHAIHRTFIQQSMEKVERISKQLQKMKVLL